MSAKLDFLVPESTVNYIKNPSIRYSTDGFVADNSTATRTLDEARFGIASLKVVTDGNFLNEGVYYRVSALAGISDVLTVSAYVRGTGTVRIRLIDNPSGDEWKSSSVELRSDRWQRIDVSGRCTGSNDMRLYVESDEEAAKSRTFYVDGFQMERKAYATTYCDGDQPGCYWNVYQHNSLSTREDTTREGGRWVEVAGPSCEKKNLYMTVIGGMGVAPISNQIQPYADAPGSFRQNYKVMDRVITVTFHAKRDNKPRTNNLPSLEHLHKLRLQLIDIVKPDKVGSEEPFWIRYQDGEKPLYLQVYYDGGLDGEWDVRNQFFNSFPLRLLATSPFFYEDDQEVDTLDFRTDTTANYILKRFEGQWGDMNGGFDDQVRAMTIGPRGEIIAVGDFTVANNDASAIDPGIFANHIAYWDGTQWNKYGVGADGIIHDVAVAPNGDIYVTGEFTNIGGAPANRVAFWNGTSWQAMGAGLNGTGYAIRVAPNGDVYVGGAFTTAGGDNMNYIARWDGSWHNLCTGPGLNDEVYTIAISPDGDLVYMGGAFTDENGDPGSFNLNYVALYYPSTDSFTDLAVGFDAAVRKLRYTNSGRLYAVGDFTQTNDGEVVLLYCAYWNGSYWYEIGVGADDIVRDIDILGDGSIVMGGDFLRIGSEDATYLVLWNDSAYVNWDSQVGGPVYAVLFDKRGNVYAAPNATNINYAQRTTVNNIGSAETSPVIYVDGPCTIRWFENQTTKKRVYMDLDVADSEEIVIDFGQGTIQSNVRGDIAYSINPGSDFRAWTLSPGNNVISALMLNDVDAKLQISYVPKHWSVDSTARLESL